MSSNEYKILVPTDFSQQSDYALQQALRFAKIVDGKVVLLYILHEKKGILGKLFNGEQEKVFNEMVKDKLIEQSKKYSQEYKFEIETKLLHSTSVHGKIVDYANDIDATLIVMGKGAIYKDGKEIPSIGSNTSRVVRHSKIPVITISNYSESLACKNILLPLDLTKETRQKVSWGIKIAKLFDSKIYVVSGIWEDRDYVARQINSQMTQVVKYIKKQGVEAKGEIIKPRGGRKGLMPVLTNYIDKHPEIDLAIIMTQQEDDFTEFFVGSAATAFIRQVTLPVLSVVPRQLESVIVGM